jgi:hypothetical protein
LPAIETSRFARIRAASLLGAAVALATACGPTAPRECASDSQCPLDEFCEAGECFPVDCDLRSSQPIGCPEDYECVRNRCAAVNGGCLFDDDCGPSGVCEAGRCAGDRPSRVKTAEAAPQPTAQPTATSPPPPTPTASATATAAPTGTRTPAPTATPT